MSGTAHHPEDKGAAYIGLFSAAIFLFVVVFSIVKWTNSRYAHESGEKPAATATP